MFDVYWLQKLFVKLWWDKLVALIAVACYHDGCDVNTTITKNDMNSFTLEGECICVSSWVIQIKGCYSSPWMRVWCLFVHMLEPPQRGAVGVDMDSLLPTPSNIVFANRIFYPDGFLLVGYDSWSRWLNMWWKGRTGMVGNWGKVVLVD